MTVASTIDCPMCGEEILAVAKKCKHCGEFFHIPLFDGSNLEFKPCPICGEEIKSMAIKCRHCNEFLTDNNPTQADTIRKIHDLEKISCALWLVIAIIQILSGAFAFVGAFNLAGVVFARKRLSKIMNREAAIIKDFEPLAGLVVIGVVNFFFGGVIGVVLVIFDLVIRNKVLSNRALFINKQQGDSK